MRPQFTAHIESVCQHCGTEFRGYRRGTGKAPRYCSSACYHVARKGTQPAGGFRSVPAEDRFWEYVDRSGGDDVCWLWTGSTDKDGYGKFWPTRDRSVAAHRYSWEAVNGPIPAGLYCLHRCDRPGCVRPDHLFVGTNRENQRDMTAKGRGRTGERNGMTGHPERSGRARLTWEQVREIRAIFAQSDPPSHQSVADAYGISRATLRAVVYRQTWRE